MPTSVTSTSLRLQLEHKMSRLGEASISLSLHSPKLPSRKASFYPVHRRIIALCTQLLNYILFRDTYTPFLIQIMAGLLGGGGGNKNGGGGGLLGGYACHHFTYCHASTYTITLLVILLIQLRYLVS